MSTSIALTSTASSPEAAWKARVLQSLGGLFDRRYRFRLPFGL
ncbi:MAG: hypothetical protein AVDCRST_MAG02-2935 [uncultured Rubrobacteraceae bacterium]|uniref:Uncharacterized protein n=1 Tax=uncultured Rubrobacteraceae bacterium TaxID=349277 RepID=A0A6J4R5N5_9ACTN|nr:MAG: hypothetical protein AVDCRST_MAG02-2935 [uncultured Rubrobacteraceae bacterium]